MSSTKSVIISCAGIGSRLGLGLTKALVQIHGRSLISLQLELLNNVKDLRIVVGFQANDIINEVLKYRNDVTFICNHHYFETKTGASYYLGARHANDYVIEWNGDTLVHPDDVKNILNKEGEFACYSEVSSEESILVDVNHKQQITSFSRLHGQYEWTGPVCLRREHVPYTTNNVYNIIEQYLPINGMKVRAYDMDTYSDYLRVSKIIKEWGIV